MNPAARAIRLSLVTFLSAVALIVMVKAVLL